MSSDDFPEVPQHIQDAYPIYGEEGHERNVLKRQFRALHGAIEALAPSGRERSTALTNLEQACMWAVKATFRK